MGPSPTLLSRKEVDALYETLAAVIRCLDELKVDYIVTGGSLLGAIRQHSILFCDDDVDIAIIDREDGAYDKVSEHLQELLGKDFLYSIKPWEGGDKVRPKHMSNVFLDVFCLRRYETQKELVDAIGVKKNGKPQSQEYLDSILNSIETCTQSEATPLYPCWHFNTRKAIEMWTNEVYKEHELFPITQDLKFGPLEGIKGPRMPVLLLKRAFGKDCFDVYYQSASHKVMKNSNKQQGDYGDCNGDHFKPLVLEGGTWETAEKVPLQEDHYLPMQPIARAKRRPTLHNKEQLFRYLAEQSKKENKWKLEEEQKESPPSSTLLSPQRTVYMDGVFDLFHVGHLQAIRQCAALGNRVIIGVTGDKDASGYKRPPIVCQEDRVAIIGALREVHHVVCPCPLIVTEDFMKEQGIDLVVHGFANDNDAERQHIFFETPINMGKFQRISYHQGLSTTGILEKIASLAETIEDDVTKKNKPQWFGAALAAATQNASEIPTDPFPLSLRQAVEPHIRKATRRRDEALEAIRQATGTAKFDKVMSTFKDSGLSREGAFSFDTELHPLRSAFLQSTGLPFGTDLSRLHEHSGAKDAALFSLTRDFSSFQVVFDSFVRNVCAPHMASLWGCDEIFYQAFPCVRIVQPDEFSIGPHADVAYGHHPCSINYYIPLTPIGGASALFMERRSGSEDWHPIKGDYGLVKHFAGAICTHWTTENKTSLTRASLDFRLIAGPLFRALACGGAQPGGQKDVYREKDGYYSSCRRVNDGDSSLWRREGELLKPDARVGFPWTVKKWDKILST